MNQHDNTYTIFVISRSDAIGFASISSIHEQIPGVRNFAVISPEDNAGRPIDPLACIAPDHAQVRGIFAWMTTHRPDLQCVRIVALQCQKLSAESQNDLLEVASWLSTCSNTYAPNVEVKQIRLGVFCEGHVSASLDLFVDSAALNLVVVPRDSQIHGGMAQPITELQHDLLNSHVQVEVATLFGLWREMSSCIIDDFEPVHGGDDRVWLRFVSSRALILECPPLPIASVVDGENDLATPIDCDSYPSPEERIGALIRSIYPEDLRFESTEPPTGLRQTDARSFWREYLSEFGRTLTRFPTLLVSDVQSELNELSGIVLQEALDGTNSRIRILYPGSVGDGSAADITPEQIEKMIDRLVSESEPSRRLVLDARHWTQLVMKTLSFVDGSDIAAGDRESIGQENWLVVDKRVLGPVSDELTKTLEVFAKCIKSTLPEFRDELRENAETAELQESPAPVDGSDTEDPDNVSDAEDVEIAAIDYSKTPDDLLPQDVFSAPMSVTAVSNDDREDAMLSASDEVAVAMSKSELDPPTVLTGVASEFNREADRSGLRVRDMINRLRQIPTEFAPREAGIISGTVRWSVFLGIALAYFVTGALTSRREWLSGENMSAYTRDFVWVSLSTLIVCLSVAGLLVKTKGRWQARAIFTLVMCTAVIGVQLTFFGAIRDFVFESQTLRTTAIVGTLVAVATLLVALVSIARNRLSTNVLRRRFASALRGLLIGFLLVGVTAYFGSDRSPLRDLTSQSQQRLALLGYVIAASFVLGAAAVHAFVVLREKYRLNLLAETLRWAEGELIESVHAERILRRAAIQWIGSATVLARLIQYPLGRLVADSTDDRDRMIKVDSNLMKFEKEELKLSDRGRHGLASRLRMLFIRRGWLSSQHHNLVRSFQRDWAFSRGLEETNSTLVEPMTCPVAPTWEQVMSDSVRGSRWQFMKSVFDGKYDDSLLVRSAEVRLEDAYSTILSDRAAHSVGDSSDLDARDYFRRLVPSGAKLLDGGLVTTIFGGNDPRQQMQTHIWWPKDLVALTEPQNSGAQVMSVHESEILSPDRISSTIRLFGSCVSVSELFTTDEIQTTRSV